LFIAGSNSERSRQAIIDHSVISGNGASYGGGGLYLGTGNTLTMRWSSVEGNGADGPGGLLLSSRTTTSLYNCTIAANGSIANGGAGLFNWGQVTMVNCTVSDNTHGDAINQTGGMAIGNLGTMDVINCTIAYNRADVYPWAGRSDAVENEGTFNVRNSIIARNTGSPQSHDFSGVLTSQGYNLIQDIAGGSITGDETGNIYGQDPLLGPLQDNGGPTLTRELLTSSPAIDAGGASVRYDQRGYIRPVDWRNLLNAADGTDIGAVELQRQDAK